MKKNILITLVAVFLGTTLFSCQPKTEKAVKEYPMFWTWIGYNAEKFDSVCQSLSELGLVL